MKALPWIALVLGAGWLLVRQGASHTLTTRIKTLESRVVTAEQALETQAADAAGEDPAHAAKSARPGMTAAEVEAVPTSADDIDLEALAASMGLERQGQMPDLKQMVRMQRFLIEADADEVAALIERAGALDVPAETRKRLLAQLVQMLAQKDPQRALELAFTSPHLDVQENPWAYTSGFTGWMKEDPATALAWFDRHIAAGTFESKSIDGRSRTRIQFEAAALGQLLGSDPDQARARLEAIPEKHRREILQQGHLLKVDQESEPAFAALVRESLPEEHQASAYTSHTNSLIRRDGYEAVGEFIRNIEATPAERQAIAAQAANNKLMEMGRTNKVPGADDLAEMRAFVQEQSPGATEFITGEALGHLASSTQNFEQAAGLLRELHAENPNDDLLVGFLQPHAVAHHREAARELASQIEDPAKREVIMKRLGNPAP